MKSARTIGVGRPTTVGRETCTVKGEKRKTAIVPGAERATIELEGQLPWYTRLQKTSKARCMGQLERSRYQNLLEKLTRTNRSGSNGWTVNQKRKHKAKENKKTGLGMHTRSQLNQRVPGTKRSCQRYSATDAVMGLVDVEGKQGRKALANPSRRS